MKFRAATAAFLLLPATALATNMIKPGVRTDAPLAGSVIDLAASIGPVTSMDTEGDTVYVGGQLGIAAVAATGEVKWTLPLPPAMLRLVTADIGHLAFTSYSVTGVDPAEGFTKFIVGGLGDVPQVSGATVGLVSPDGKLVWSVDAFAQAPLAPPGLSASSVGVSLGKDFAAHDLADGHVLGHSETSGYSPVLEGFLGQATRSAPVAQDGSFYSAFMLSLRRTDLSGNEIAKENGAGLWPYNNITCGPVVVDGLIVFGNSGNTALDVANNVFATDKELKGTWKEHSADYQSGCGSIAGNGTNVFFASNFSVMAFTPRGKMVWDSSNKKGGLYPSEYRGLRYTRNFAIRRSHGEMMAADAKHVFIASGYGEDDVVTALDATNGEWISAMNVGSSPIVSLAMVGDRLAVASTTDLRFVTVD